VRLYCLVQVDIKIIVAYFSVVHMNFMMASLFSLLKMRVIDRIVVIISHRLCSSDLFYGLWFILYEYILYLFL